MQGSIQFACLTGVVLTAAALLFFWLVFSPRVSPGLYARYLFQPESYRGEFRDLINFSGVRHFEVPMRARDGSYLRGWMFLNADAHKVILVHQGNAGDIPGHLDFIRLLLETGASVFFYEPRGYGVSGGKPSIANLLVDGETAFDHLVRKLEVDPSKIVVYGVSLGCGVATHVARKMGGYRVVLQSGFSSLERIAKERVPMLRLFPKWLFPPLKLDNLAELGNVNMPLLILHGLKDDVIAPHHSVMMYQKAWGGKELVLLKDSDHTSIAPEDREIYLAAVKDLMSR